MLLLDEKRKRREINLKYQKQGIFTVGTKVKAIYSDDDNEPAWYEAKIDSKADEQDQVNKYWVTFTEYGNQSCVDLGDMQLSEPPKKEQESGEIDSKIRSRSNSKGNDRHRHRSRSNSRKREREDSGDNTKSLMDKVIQSQREASTAIGKNYGVRPTSYKGSLSLKLDRYTARKEERVDSYDNRRYQQEDRDRFRKRSPSPEKDKSSTDNNDSSSIRTANLEQVERIKRLKASYGDASSTRNNE